VAGASNGSDKEVFGHTCPLPVVLRLTEAVVCRECLEHTYPDTFRMRSRGSEYLVNRKRSVAFAADVEPLRFTSVWPASISSLPLIPGTHLYGVTFTRLLNQPLILRGAPPSSRASAARVPPAA